MVESKCGAGRRVRMEKHAKRGRQAQKLIYVGTGNSFWRIARRDERLRSRLRMEDGS